MRPFWRRISLVVRTGRSRPDSACHFRAKSLPGLFPLEGNMPALERAAVVERRSGKINIIHRQRSNFSRSSGREVPSQLEHDETRALAAFQLFLFGIERSFRVDAR